MGNEPKLYLRELLRKINQEKLIPKFENIEIYIKEMIYLRSKLEVEYKILLDKKGVYYALIVYMLE